MYNNRMTFDGIARVKGRIREAVDRVYEEKPDELAEVLRILMPKDLMLDAACVWLARSVITPVMSIAPADHPSSPQRAIGGVFLPTALKPEQSVTDERGRKVIQIGQHPMAAEEIEIAQKAALQNPEIEEAFRAMEAFLEFYRRLVLDSDGRYFLRKIFSPRAIRIADAFEPIKDGGLFHVAVLYAARSKAVEDANAQGCPLEGRHMGEGLRRIHAESAFRAVTDSGITSCPFQDRFSWLANTHFQRGGDGSYSAQPRVFGWFDTVRDKKGHEAQDPDVQEFMTSVGF